MLFAGHLIAQEDNQKELNELINKWHKAASEADYETYFGILAEDGVFIGTDASENWQNESAVSEHLQKNHLYLEKNCLP